MGVLTQGVVYKPVDEVDLGPNSDEVYIQANVKAPRMAGFVVKIFTWFLELKFVGPMLVYMLKRNNLIHKKWDPLSAYVRVITNEEIQDCWPQMNKPHSQLVSYAELEPPPIFVPLHPHEDVNDNKEVRLMDIDTSPPEQVKQAMNCLPSCLENPKPSFYRWTVRDYSRAYSSGEITPLMVAERFIAAVQESSKLKMSFFINYNADDILKQAKESTLRYQKGEPISALDGVPIAVKDEIDCMPYPTTGGSKWLSKVRHCKEDACCVKRLRLCGAILVGKTNMHELGAGTSGINPHYGAARNPYDATKITGGSSSGSAAVVAAGLCPAALGVDGGGSVRMPAALCGVVGFKPTFARIPHSGVIPLNWTVGMVGVLAGTIEDAFIVYAAISGELPTDHPTTPLPRVCFPLLHSSNFVNNIKMAKYGKWFDDCSDEIRVCCSNALQKLNKIYGWETVEVTIPEIEVMRLAHYLSIASEFSSSLGAFLKKLDITESGWDVRAVLNIYSSFDANEYLNAQKIRNRQIQLHRKIFEKADVIVTPTTGVTAYSIKDDALQTGELDYINGAALIRYQIAGNFLGLPAVTVPVGYDKTGLPIGLQFIGRPWSEPLLIQIAYAMQKLCISDCRKPEVFYDLLKEV